MAESKRTFQSAKMDKDVDDRILPQGTYRDALNVSVEFSEDGNVGALENLKGNSAVVSSFPPYLDTAINTGVKVIGSIPHPEENKIYYFFSGAVTDGIVEYDETTSTLNPIVLDSTTENATQVVAESEVAFTFSDAVVSGSVSVDGIISVQSQKGIATAITTDFNETVGISTVRDITVSVKVPDGYTNSGGLVQGVISPTQPPVGSPNVHFDSISNIGDTTVTFNAYYDTNQGLTAIGFKYVENSSGAETQTIYNNTYIASTRNIYGDTITPWEESTGDIPFYNVPSSDIGVLDSNNALVGTANFTVETFENGRPLNVVFDSSYDRSSHDHFTVVQLSSATTITNGVSGSYIQTSGTDVPVTPITSEFKADITGLTADTNYAVIAYATNAQGTTYTQPFYFKTNVASILLPNFSNAGATAGTALVIFSGTPTNNGGDANTELYVVSNETSGTVADFKTAAATLIGGGTASGYALNTIGSFTIGVAQSVSVPTTGGATRQGLVFAKNSSSDTSGSDPAGYTFDTALVSAQANQARVYGLANFSGTISGPTTATTSSTINWSVSGTATVTAVGSGPGSTNTMEANQIFVYGIASEPQVQPGTGWVSASPSVVNTIGGTSTFSGSTTSTAPSVAGTYNWVMALSYDENNMNGAYITGQLVVT